MPAPKGYRRRKLANWRLVCAKGSIRRVKSGKAIVLVCCPRSHWKRGRCKVGMRAVSLDVPRGFGGIRRSYERVPNLTIPYQRALLKVGNAGIGHPGTQRKVEFLLRWGLIRKVPNTAKYEVTAKGWKTVSPFEGLATDARKEHREHPWTTMAQARRIARDHAKKKR